MEVELKAKAPRGIEKKLVSLGAKKKYTKKQVDVLYDQPDHRLTRIGAALRVREEEGKTFLTYKSPSKSKKVKAKEEIELKVTPAVKILLHGLGYSRVAGKEKVRTDYSFNGVSISIDKVKSLGTWVEFEVVGPMVKSHKKILATAKKLGIPEKDLTPKSYMQLIREKLKSKKRQKQ